jgi:hypothetical protein
MPRRPGVLLLFAVATLLLAGAARRRAVEPLHPLDARRSFVVTDQAILDGFSFDRVMNAIVARSGTPTTALRLYQQLFDTQNPKPGRVAPDAAHCDDFMVNGQATFNGLPRRCPTAEGALAMTDPFAAGDHIPLALVNRFDLAPADGANCGQYRIIFAKKSNATFTRVHFIFEAVLPNPNPAEGIAGCRAVAQFWADLSHVNSISERQSRLDAFFFRGIDGFDPVIDPDHFTAASGGGIRTMHNANAPLGNRFYQFRLAKRGDQLIAVPDVLQNQPYGRFFDATYDTETARRFRDAFIANVGNLAIPDQNLFFMNIPRDFLLVESNPGESELDVVFEIPFLASQLTSEGRAFSNRISTELRKSGSRLSPTDIVKRANELSCTGCHFFRGNVGDFEFYQQISESIIETGEAGPRFAISRTMRDVFVPHRMEVLTNFLKSGTAPPGTAATIGGGVE